MESPQEKAVLRNTYDGSPYDTSPTKSEELQKLKAELEMVENEAYRDGVITPKEEAAAQELVEKIKAIEGSEYIAENADADTVLASLDALSATDLPMLV